MAPAIKMMLCGILVFCSIAPLFAQVNISGTVIDQAGQPVQGVAVSLGGVSLTATTGTDGRYLLSASSSVKSPHSSWAVRGRPVLENGILKFRVNEARARVRIDIYNLLGSSIATLSDRELVRGDYTLNMAARNLASQLYFLNVKIGSDVTVIKMSLPEKMPLHGPVAAGNGTLSSNGLEKTAAAADTVKARKTGYSLEKKPVASYTGTCNFIITDTAWFWGNRATIPAAKNVMTYVYLNRTYGAYTDAQIFWSTGGQTHSIAEQPTYDMAANSSGRVTFHLGTATGQYSEFMEHTISATVWNGNTTRVDAWALPIVIRLHCKDGYDAILGDEYHVFAMKRDSVFKLFKNEVPVEFAHCADNGYPTRIIAPGKGDGGFGANQQYAGYMIPYLTQLGISGPTTEQVFACAGNPFGSNAGLAGAVNRHVAQLPQAQWKDVTKFYLAAPANYFAKFWHEHSVDSKCYGFAYDDAEGQAAYTSHSGPQYLIIAIGF